MCRNDLPITMIPIAHWAWSDSLDGFVLVIPEYCLLFSVC